MLQTFTYFHFRGILQEYFEEVNSAFENAEIDTKTFTAAWAISLFTHAVPLKYSAKLLDQIFEHKWMGFFNVVYGVFSAFESKLIFVISDLLLDELAE